MITVSFHSILRMELCCKEIELDRFGITVHEALLECERIIGKPFVEELLDPSRKLHRPMILINGGNISLQEGYEAIIPEGAHLTVLPPAGGG